MAEIFAAALRNEISSFFLNCLTQTIGQVILTFFLMHVYTKVSTRIKREAVPADAEAVADDTEE